MTHAETNRLERTARACLTFLALLALAACGPTDAGAQVSDPLSPDHPGRLVRLPDGRRINLRCVGHGAPTVVLESGFAADSLAWGRVQAKVGQSTQVCAYDRAGAGYSDPGPMPRDGAAISRDLDRALRIAGVHGPYIVVGHSAGGLYGQIFAARRSGQIAGMVLVDSSVPHQDQRVAAVAGPGAGSIAPLRARAQRCLDAAKSTTPEASLGAAGCLPKREDRHAHDLALRPATWEAQISEIETLFGLTSDQAESAAPSLRDIPAIVLTADNGGNSPPGSLWWALHEEMAERFRRHDHRSVASGHLIMVEHPDVVSAAILELVAAARHNRSG